MVLVRHGDPATTTMWKYEEGSGTGSFSVEGSYDDCTYAHTGSLDRGFTADLGLVPSSDLYWLDIVADGEGTRTLSCPEGGGTGTASFQAWGATEGGPEAIAWDRTQSAITGTWVEDDDYRDVDIDWVVTPLPGTSGE
jgi:hypothetical protein